MLWTPSCPPLLFPVLYTTLYTHGLGFRWVSLGSIIAVTLWLVFSVLFSLYVNNFGSYNATYGSLAGVAIFLFYIYYSALIMLVGAEMNQVIEGHIPEGKNEGEKTI